MTERSPEQKRRTWIVRFVAAVVLIAIGVGWRGFSRLQSALAEESQGGPPKARRLPGDLVGVSDAKYASLEGLAPGSREAQERQRQAVQQLGLPLEVKTRKTGIVFRLIPAGSFAMGSPEAEKDVMVKAGIPRELIQSETKHQVTLTKAFYCGKFEVTQGQWEQVMGSNPSYFKNAGRDASVETVSWNDCQAFVTKLCRIEGVPLGTYRLLTEAEWEYACRAGTQTALYNGAMDMRGASDATALDPIAWYRGNSGVDYEGDHKRAGAHPVGGKRANGFGLCDMIGNVLEWCRDWHEPYLSDPATDPAGPASGNLRILRGGGWVNLARYCRSASRLRVPPGDRNFDFGLRLARTTPSYEEPRPVNKVVKVAEPSAQPHSHQPLLDALP